ncbi:MAG: lipid-A-disaccharide synthase [Gammaproteobacteria bacterium]|nr:lipid-A-disaccharide synthase [Gammaproteobacteria bacterium]
MTRIGLVAGEASGDILAADLMAGLRTIEPGFVAEGIAGPRMQAAGCEALFDSEKLSVMGLAEVLKHLPELLAIRREISAHFLAQRPDVFVGIDAPDFNLGLEKSLKAAGIPTVHYVSPSVWAWRASRAERIGQSADRVLTLFPFEPEIYARYDVDAVFVGHPLADAIPLEIDQDAYRRTLGLATDRLVLAILPGSRMSEVSRLLPEFLATARWLGARFKGLKVIMPMATPRIHEHVREVLARERARGIDLPDVELFEGQSREVMGASDAVLLASGTAALEAMLLKRPMVVSYRLAWLTHAIVRLFGLLKVEQVSLPNVLAGQVLVPELMQDRCQSELLGQALLPLLEDSPERRRQVEPFHDLHLALRQDAAARSAEAVMDMVRK